jgi:hypothetical protein
MGPCMYPPRRTVVVRMLPQLALYYFDPHCTALLDHAHTVVPVLVVYVRTFNL